MSKSSMLSGLWLVLLALLAACGAATLAAPAPAPMSAPPARYKLIAFHSPL